ncbi:MAG: peptidyl-tRNA hydrolase [Nanoarchaeota archaeon]|nr:peptidyl-tRNA hydrolase [Nanoarchaeota archaeon]
MKQVILIRADLKLPKGKMAAQAAHASVEAVLRSDRDTIKEWRMAGAAKIALKIDTREDLYIFQDRAKQKGLVCALITDAGKTVIAPGTETCLAIGPDEDGLIDSVTGGLKLV